MKPPQFEYHRAASVEDAIAALAQAPGDGKVLAGGQSLVPMLNYRLARPALLVDLNGVSELAYIRRDDGRLRIGAMTRTRRLETDPTVGSLLPILREAAGWVGHIQIRNRGTVGGSVAHADPAAELPAISLLLEAELRLAGPRGTRTVAADGFFQGFFATGIAEGEVLTEVALPIAATRSTWGFREFAPRHGDFALAGAGCVLELAADRSVDRAAAVVFGLGEVPTRLPAVEASLSGRRLDEASIRDSARRALEAVEAIEDVRPDARHRRQVAAVLLDRALQDAARRADA